VDLETAGRWFAELRTAVSERISLAFRLKRPGPSGIYR